MAAPMPGAAPGGPPAYEATTGPLVPTKLLAIPGIALVMLITGILLNAEWALGFLHVGFGAVWTGFDLFAGFMVGPVLKKLDPPMRVAFMKRYGPRMLVVMPTLATITLAAGFQLARKAEFLTMSYPRHWWLVGSFALVGVMATSAFAILLPSNLQVLMELKKPQPNFALVGKLSARYSTFAAVAGVSQLITLIIMTRLASF
jgi:hypothetical protein